MDGLCGHVHKGHGPFAPCPVDPRILVEIRIRVIDRQDPTEFDNAALGVELRLLVGTATHWDQNETGSENTLLLSNSCGFDLIKFLQHESIRIRSCRVKRWAGVTLPFTEDPVVVIVLLR